MVSNNSLRKISLTGTWKMDWKDRPEGSAVKIANGSYE